MSPEEFSQLCKDLEHWETDEWASRKILRHELMTRSVIDPCAGTGILCKAAAAAGYFQPFAIDIKDWGFPLDLTEDFLTLEHDIFNGPDFSIFMNPPFSLAEKFVEKSFAVGARKIICFQKFSWWEGSYDKGKKRGQWWDKYPPNRIYICGDRATCWRHDIPKDQRADSGGGGTPTAHAWFVWEVGNPSGTLISHIYKDASPRKKRLASP